MANNKVQKKQPEKDKGMRAFDPTKSKVGKVVLVILAAGMFLGMLIAAIYGMINVLKG